MFKLAIAGLHVRSSAAAEKFYCNRLGFRPDFAYRPDETRLDPCYKDVRIDLEPTDQAWGNREMYVKDPDGNSIRFVREGARRIGSI